MQSGDWPKTLRNTLHLEEIIWLAIVHFFVFYMKFFLSIPTSIVLSSLVFLRHITSRLITSHAFPQKAIAFHMSKGVMALPSRVLT